MTPLDADDVLADDAGGCILISGANVLRVRDVVHNVFARCPRAWRRR
jgi:hypothetical protein